MNKLLILFAMMFMLSGCVFSSKPVDRNIIMVIPGAPVWLVEDIKNVQVLAKDAKGQMKLGTTTLRAGCVVWYDKQFNDKTIKAIEDK